VKEGGKPNHLISEKSPYLLQHAYNPIDWYPWGDEALKKAKNDGKPIFLSIGYSSCHWCHTFAHESFEDPAIAAIINKNFIPIKVDREERPQLDSYYMNAVQAMTGQGGWPLSVFLTPDLKPFYGGTYFPPEPRYGMPSFRQLLEFVARLWRESKGEVSKNAEQIAQAIQIKEPEGATKELTRTVLDEGYAALAASFDPEHGGFGSVPKFPLPLYLEFMVQYHFRTGKELALRILTKTLDEISRGGIRDHVAGGFHRYSTDRTWLVPHFEKMLYDNALLVRSYLHAFQVTGEARYAGVARDTLRWIIAELGAPEGGFYSAQDADTEEGEGVFYTWTPTEVERVLGQSAGEVFNHIYGVTRTGNFEHGRSILRLASTVEEAASKFGMDRRELEKSLEGWSEALYRARLKRPRPATDTKVLTSWNGLAISALADAYKILGERGYAEAGRRAADFILRVCLREGRLMRRFADGEVAIEGTLEDYAFMAAGLLDLFEATAEPSLLENSVALAKKMIEAFWDPEKGGFFAALGSVPVRMKEGYDGPIPSGNSSAAVLLLRLSEITGDQSFRDAAEKTIRHFQAGLEREPSAHTQLLAAADLLLNGMREVVVTAGKESDAAEMARAARARFLPDVVLLVATKRSYEGLSRLTPLLEGRRPGGMAVAYVCQNFACKVPARSRWALEEQLGIG